jgi:phosphate-selective porin
MYHLVVNRASLCALPIYARWPWPRGPSGQLVGIELPAATFGLNWYLSDRVRVLFNYTYNVPNEPNTGTSVANIFGTRLNVYW